MIDQNLRRFLDCFLGVDRTVGGYFKGKFVVVGFLVDAIVLDCVLDVLYGCVDGVDRDCLEIVVRSDVLLGGYPSAAFVDCQYDCETCVLIQMTDHQVGVHDLEARQGAGNVAGREHFFA